MRPVMAHESTDIACSQGSVIPDHDDNLTVPVYDEPVSLVPFL